MRSGGLGNLRVGVAGADGECFDFGNQIADLVQKTLVVDDRHWIAYVGPVKVVYLGLQGIASGKQLTVARSKIPHHTCQAAPEVLGTHPGAGQRFQIDKIVEDLGNAKRGDVDSLRRVHLSLVITASTLGDKSRFRLPV